MKLSELLEKTGIARYDARDAEISGICTDSRKCGPGSLFVALPGLTSGRQGHDFIPMALEHSAAAVVTDEAFESAAPVVVVPDTQRALTRLASEFYGNPQREMKMVGVTGTKGKTSVTHYIKSVLDRIPGVKCGLIGTNHIIYGDVTVPAGNTTPEPVTLYGTLAAMRDAGVTHAVMEVSSHSLATGRVDAIDFAVGVFLNLASDHLDFHKTRDEYARAKSLLFSRSETSVINIDDDYAPMMIAAAKNRVFTFSIDRNDADLEAKNLRYAPDRAEFEALTATGLIRRARVNSPGKFSVDNALATVAACLALGVPLGDAIDGLASAPAVPGRAEVVNTGLPFTTVVDYAHTAGSLREILTAMRPFAANKLIVVFGCGGNRDRTKRPEMCAVVAELADRYIVTSDNPRDEEPEAIIAEIVEGDPSGEKREVEPDRRKAIRRAMDMASKGDMIVVAGKGHEDYQEIKGVKHHFDDREEILNYAKSK